MRKSIVLSLFSVLLLVAGAVMAQLPQHNTSFGTVLSYTPGEQLVISTDDGQEAFKIISETTLPSDDEIEPGAAVVVDWNVAESADAMPEVRAIRLDDRPEAERTAAADQDTDVTATAEVETETETEDFGTETDTDVDVDAEVETRTTTSTSTTRSNQQDTQSTRSSLPQTGSNLPLVGLIGLLTLAGAATLTLRR